MVICIGPISDVHLILGKFACTTLLLRIPGHMQRFYEHASG